MHISYRCPPVSTQLFFEINSAAVICQKEIRKALCGLKGVLNVSDDIRSVLFFFF